MMVWPRVCMYGEDVGPPTPLTPSQARWLFESVLAEEGPELVVRCLLDLFAGHEVGDEGARMRIAE